MRKTVIVLTATILATGSGQLNAKEKKTKPTISEISVTKNIDSSTPKLMTRKARKDQMEYTKFKLDNATISNYSQKSSVSPSGPKAGYDVKRNVKQ